MKCETPTIDSVKPILADQKKTPIKSVSFHSSVIDNEKTSDKPKKNCILPSPYLEKESKKKTPMIKLLSKGQKEVKTMTSNYLSCLNIHLPAKALVLVDTGAEEANVISKNYYDLLIKSNVKLNLSKDNTRVYAINSKPLVNYGKISLSLTFGDLILSPTDFLVVEKLGSYDIILGLPAIQEFKILPNIPEGTIQIMGKNFKLNRNQSYQKLIPVRTTKDVKIPPRKESTLAVSLSSDCFKEAQDYYHSVIPSQAIRSLPFLTMPEAATKNHLHYVQVTNWSDKPITIKKGALVAYIKTISQDSVIQAISMDELHHEDVLLGEEMFIPDSVRDKNFDLTEIDDHLENQPEKLEQFFHSSLLKLLYSFADLFLTDKHP